MNKKRWISAILALASAVCLLPTSAFAAESATIEYTLEPGKSYRITNNNPNEEYQIGTTGAGTVRYEKAEYQSDGTAANYSKDAISSFKVNKGGYTDITGSHNSGTLYFPYEWGKYITVTEISHSALNVYPLDVGISYHLANSNPNAEYQIGTTGAGTVRYEKAEYQSDGTAANYSKDAISSFKVNKGGYTDITGSHNSGTLYFPYEWGKYITVTEISHSALNVYPLDVGISYRLANSNPNAEYQIGTTGAGTVRYEKAEYQSDGTATNYSKDAISSFRVNKGGYTDITGSHNSGTLYFPYEWNQSIVVMDADGNVLNQGQSTSQIPAQAFEYIYDISDPGENVTLDTARLDSVSDSVSASSAVQSQTQSMTTEQKNSATGADLATLYAETAVAKAASKKVSGSEIIINKAAVSDLETVAAQTSAAVEIALVNGGITTARLVSNTVTLTTDETGEITIKIDPDILTTQVDKIRVETPTYAITLKVADLKEDLTEILTITAQDVGSGFAAGNQSKKATVKVNLPKGKTSNPVTLSLPTDNNDTTYQAVVKTDGSATSSKYNPATTTMDGKVNTSGSYTVQTNQKDFTDIANKSAEMQKAIRYLASKGIINGTSATEFSPDGSINRAEIAALLVRVLGKLDKSATNSFTDVKASDWYYSAAGSSQKCGLINGYTDNTFRGTTSITKEQIVAVAARVLTSEMGYKAPSNTASYLGKYSDSVATWAQPEVALATKENLVVYRVDGTFKGTGNMTRGDAAIIIYRLFQKIW